MGICCFLESIKLRTSFLFQSSKLDRSLFSWSLPYSTWHASWKHSDGTFNIPSPYLLSQTHKFSRHTFWQWPQHHVTLVTLGPGSFQLPFQYIHNSCCLSFKPSPIPLFQMPHVQCFRRVPTYASDVYHYITNRLKQLKTTTILLSSWILWSGIQTCLCPTTSGASTWKFEQLGGQLKQLWGWDYLEASLFPCLKPGLKWLCKLNSRGSVYLSAYPMPLHVTRASLRHGLRILRRVILWP